MKKCPHCGSEIFCLNLYCPYCKSPIKDYFTIEAFLKENFQFFTILGVMGTMISLLPNLGNLIFGENWISKDIFLFFSIFLTLIIYFGGIFIIAIFFIIIVKIFEYRKDEKSRLILKKIYWYKGDFQRLLLLACLLPMMIGFLFFIIPSIIFIPNRTIIMSIILIFGLVIGGTGFLYYKLIKIFTKPIHDLITYSEKYNIPIAIILIISFLVTLILLYAFFTVLPVIMAPSPYSDNIKIQPVQLYYSPLISPMKGLQLDVTNISSDQLTYTSFQWSTNYGYFISFTPSGMNEKILGDKCEQTSLRIHWTYPTEDIEQNKNPVTIKLNVIDLNSNSIVGNTSLNLTWFTKDIVFVNYSYR
jgi:hypothetical protein